MSERLQEPLPKTICRNGIYYELCGEQYYPCLLVPPEPDASEEDQLRFIIRQMAEAQGIDEDLKARDPMAWVGAMNNIKSATLEIMRDISSVYAGALGGVLPQQRVSGATS